MFKLESCGEGGGGSPVKKKGKGKKKSFLNIVENYFLWTVLRVDILCWSSLIITSAIYNQNTQRASSDQLICWLWPRLSFASCSRRVCVPVGVCVGPSARSCHSRFGWLGAGPRRGRGEPQRGSRRPHTRICSLSLSWAHLQAVLFFIQKTHSIKCRLNKHENALERACVHNWDLGITEHWICTNTHVTRRLLMEAAVAQRAWTGLWINAHHIWGKSVHLCN